MQQEITSIIHPSFVMTVLEAQPIVVITPYGVSAFEVMNIIIESLHRGEIPNIYVNYRYPLDDLRIPIYQEGPGVLLTMHVPTHLEYIPGLIPIYIVEWGVRLHHLQSYYEWIGETTPIIHIYPQFLPATDAPKFHSIQVPTPEDKIESPRVTIPSAIYCHPSQVNQLRSTLRPLGVPIYIGDSQTPRIIRGGILITTEMSNLTPLSPEIPIYLLAFDSSHGMALLAHPHRHQQVFIFLARDSPDIQQYNQLLTGIQDANFIYELLVSISHPLRRDMYNNLWLE